MWRFIAELYLSGLAALELYDEWVVVGLEFGEVCGEEEDQPPALELVPMPPERNGGLWV